MGDAEVQLKQLEAEARAAEQKRKEVRLLHQLAPVARVEVAAAYTGSSYWAPSSD